MSLPRSRWLMLSVACILCAAALGIALGARRSGSQLHVILVDSPAEVRPATVAEITGAVRSPGIYPVHAGDRVADLVAAAGGLLPEADLRTLNEAKRVGDGDHVVVPAMAVDLAPPRVRINHASQEELLTLPGVTVQLAAFIQRSVRQLGPMASADELVARKLMDAPQAGRLAGLIDWSP